MRTSFLFRFNEQADWARPADAAGNLVPLAPPAGLSAPASVGGLVGRARQWGAASGFETTEAVAGASRLTRDVTLEFVGTIPWRTTNGTYRLVTRGRGSSAAERELYGLQVVVSGAPSAPVVQLKMRWQVAGGAAATVPAVTVVLPGEDLYIAAVRRWISAGDVEVDYVVNGEWVGTVASTGGDIGEGDGGHVLVGIDATPAGMPIGAVIDDLRASGVARTLEELRQTYRRMFVFGGYGYELLKALQPPGNAWSRHPDSKLQRLFMVAGDGLGIAWAKAAELLEDFLPDRAWSFLDRWETVTRLSPRSSDSIATRRARVIAFLRKIHGYSREQILEQVAPLLDAEPADLVYLEPTNLFWEPFLPASFVGTSGPVEPIWLDTEDDAQVSYINGDMTMSVSVPEVGVRDLRWNGSVRNAMIIRTTVPAEEQVEIATRMTQFQSFAAGGFAGLCVLDMVTGNAHLFGVKSPTLSDYFLWHATIIDGVFAEVVSAIPVAITDYIWLRYVDRGGGLADLDYQIHALPGDGSYDGPWTSAWAGAPTIGERHWAGLFLGTTVNPVSNFLQSTWEDFRLYAPRSGHVFQWMIYRDPALGGSPDLPGAIDVIRRLKPAHTRGAITEALTLYYDDAETTADNTPLGA